MLLDIFYIHLIFYLPHNFPTLLQLFYFYPCSRCERTKRKIARLFFLILIDRSERPKKRKINLPLAPTSLQSKSLEISIIKEHNVNPKSVQSLTVPVSIASHDPTLYVSRSRRDDFHNPSTPCGALASIRPL